MGFTSIQSLVPKVRHSQASGLNLGQDLDAPRASEVFACHVHLSSYHGLESNLDVLPEPTELVGNQNGSVE